MSLLSVDEFESVVGTGADPDVIQDAIDREEAELAHELGGPLSGERTEVLRPGPWYVGPLFLRRFTDAVTVADAGADVHADSIRLIGGGGLIERSDGAWRGTVQVTYTPNDERRVIRALIELVRDVIVPDRDREAGSNRPDTVETSARRRQRLVRSLRPRVGHTIVTVGATDRITPADSSPIGTPEGS